MNAGEPCRYAGVVSCHAQRVIIGPMTGVWSIATACGTQGTRPPNDRALARLAERQHGVVALSQLKGLGLSPSGVRTRVAAGRLHRVHRGVYAVGHSILKNEGRWLAAVLACGPGAALSHRAGAALLGLRPSARAVVDVTSPRRTGRKRAGIDVHAGDTLRAADVTSVSGIWCTTVSRTLLDLAEVLDRRALERACDQAEVLRLFDHRGLADVLARARGRRGATILATLLAEHRAGETVTRSQLEERFLDICTAAGLPRPTVNAHVWLDGSAIEVDFHWPAHRLAVETDGHASHGTRQAFERDRERDRHLVLAGWRVVRFTWRQVIEAPSEVAGTLRALLAGTGRPPHPLT